MHRRIRVRETTETVTILSSTDEGTYRIIWHRSDGEPEEEFLLTPDDGDTVEDAVAKDLKRRLGP